MTESAREAVAHLRDPSMLQWYVIPLFAFVVYVYATEIRQKNWDLVLPGTCFSLKGDFVIILIINCILFPKTE